MSSLRGEKIKFHPPFKNKKGDDILKIFLSETTAPIGTKLCLIL
jgi:hypothetical protein